MTGQRAYMPERRLLSIVACIFLGVLTWAGPVPADVLYVHSVEANRFWTGEEKGTLRVAYRRDAVLYDLQKAYTGSWMQRLFGEAKKERRSTLFLIDAGEIRDVAWASDKAFVYPLERVKDAQWLRSLVQTVPEVEEVVSQRYEVRPPRLTVTETREEQRVEGYPCRKVVAHLQLETFDRKKNAVSITEVRQVMWLSQDVPGAADRLAARRSLSQRLGLDAERLGNLGSLLEYWEGPLDPIRSELEKVHGYPVKTRVEVDARYEPLDGKGRRVKKRIKEEALVLKEVLTEIPENFAVIPSHFSVVRVR
ncbi:hypothetical protein SAMN02745206_02780 [Desulfacinum infernum DSM 9756]|uniref:DUF4412 domain-containing protein n=1 Tax=Desulfacinum infernum DSM 9756 TaxID=1121391 RepID=A0A1M5F0B5_9BACT|nr:hypothetical protein [Desulfacinum infernum]SHF84975.1 hypothetical protein SAMN02745206_02780 [Desulfacinum infernum DSM 9756]